MTQRWKQRRDSYRPAGEPIDTRRYEVAEIPSDARARAFVLENHYSASYPAARFRFGLYRSAELVGVAVFSHPSNNASLTNVFPCALLAGVELGRFVLLDDVPANGETWMVARCFEQLRRHGIEGVLSCSDPVSRSTSDGRTFFGGHVGTIYQAHNAVYLGRTRSRTRLLLPDATELNERLVAKVKAAARNERAAVELLASFGAPSPEQLGGPLPWLAHVLKDFTRPLSHGGNHKYAWGLGRSVRRSLPSSLPYPKDLDQPRRAA